MAKKKSLAQEVADFMAENRMNFSFAEVKSGLRKEFSERTFVRGRKIARTIVQSREAAHAAAAGENAVSETPQGGSSGETAAAVNTEADTSDDSAANDASTGSYPATAAPAVHHVH